MSTGTAPSRIPATSNLDFPYEVGDEFAGSSVLALPHNPEKASVRLRTGQVYTYHLELHPGGGGTWVFHH